MYLPTEKNTSFKSKMSKRIGEITMNRFYRDARSHRNRILNEMLGVNENVVVPQNEFYEIGANPDEVNEIIPDLNVENIENPVNLPDGEVNEINRDELNENGNVEDPVNRPDAFIEIENVENPVNLPDGAVNRAEFNEIGNVENPVNLPDELLEIENVEDPANMPDELQLNEVDNLVDLADDEPDEVNQIPVDVSFRSKLANLVKKGNFSRVITNELLKLQRENGHPELPKTKETLLGTPRYSIHPRPCGGESEYYHFGIEKQLMKCNYRFLSEEDEVVIDIGIDGLSLSKSSKLKIWPITGAFVNKPNFSPFLIGCYEGSTDPPCIDLFTLDLVEELKIIAENGVKVTPSLIVKPLKIRAFICDTPARSMVTGCLGHASYHGCNKCDQVGIYLNKIVYLTTRGNSRTDVSFFNREQPEHHLVKFRNQHSLLETIEIGMVSQFPLDPMHALDSGVMKRILGNIMSGKFNNCHLRNEERELMDSVNLRMIAYIPSEFERKPRSLITELSRFKAVEFRLFLLYTGLLYMCLLLKSII